MDFTFNPLTGKLDVAGASAADIEKSQQAFYGATPISEGTYWGKIATLRMKTGSSVAHHLVACFHIMRCNMQPYVSVNREKVTASKECTLFVSASSIHYIPLIPTPQVEYLASMVFESSHGIGSDEIRLNKVGYEDGYCVLELWGKLEYKDRLYFTCRWNQMDKENVSLELGTPDDTLVGGFPSDTPFHNPIASETSEHELTLSANTAVTFTHNLNKFPSVTFINSNGDMVLADVHYNSRNSITIRFNADFTGLMVLN